MSELTPRAIDQLLELAAPLAERPELGALDTERYAVRGELGRGGSSVVYEAWDAELHRVVALKVFSRPTTNEVRLRFLHEARAAARLAHPHVAAVYDGTPEVIAMQRVRGPSLAEAGIRDPRVLAALVRDAALAIHYAHGEGLVHRDLKPANLMVELGERPHVYVMDFGLALEREVDASLSASGSVVGTPAYMAPEQASGERIAVGPATDVYGLGATLWSCLAGRAPFEGDDVYSVLRQVVENEPPPLRRAAPEVDADLATIVAKCMEKDSRRRYSSALALASDLDRWLRCEPIEARPSSPLYRLRRFARRRQGAVLASAGAAGLALLAALPLLVAARARSAANAEKLVLTERALDLSHAVDLAVRDARSARNSGAGREQGAFALLQAEVERCEAFLGADPEVAYGWFLLGRLLREQGRNDEAVDAFDEAEARNRDIGGRSIDGLALERGLALAALYRNAVPVAGEPPPPELERWRERGARDLAGALGEDVSEPTLERLFAEGQHAWLAGDVDRALSRLREVVEMDVAHREAHLSLSRLYLLTGRVDLGMRHSVRATDLLRGSRPAYVAPLSVPSFGGDALASSMAPERDLLAIDGLDELLFDYSLLVQLDPSDARTWGLRGQVSLRRALRALESGALGEARAGLEQAAREYGAALELAPTEPWARVCLGAVHALEARLLARIGERTAAARALELATADYDAALAHRPGLAAALHDRAILRSWHATQAALALSPDARATRERAQADALAALAAAGDDHPWRERLRTLADELGERIAFGGSPGTRPAR